MAPPSQTSGPIRFGNYLLDELIAVGGMARVYRARLRGLGGFEKTLVVKQILPELATDPRFVAMFVEEAKTVVRMSHPHIVPVYELGVIDGTYFLSMEYVDGATLAEILRGGPLAPELTAHVGVQLADALHFAHTRFDMVHRDVTPRNVLVDSSGHVRLVDFGIAAPSTLDGEGEVFGSPGYMSPEQVLREAIGIRSDLFSLGTVLYEMLTGEAAFRRGEKDATRAAILVDPIPRLEARAELPTELARIVDGCIERDPSMRPASAAELARSLRGWLAAHHPEGVADQLGKRAAEASRRDGSQPPSSQPATMTDGAFEAESKTLATSPVLTALLEGGEATDAPVVPSAAGPLSSTQPITERVKALAEADGQAAERRPRIRVKTWLMAIAAALLVGAGLSWGLRSGESARAPAPAREVPPAPAPAPDLSPTTAPSPSPAPAPAPAPAPDAPPDAPAQIEPGRLSINALPWAEVHVDGRSIGNTPLRRVPIAPGTHTLRIDCPPLGRSETLRIEVEAGQTARVVADMSVDPPSVSIRGSRP